ncbi:hypothetical protein ES703_116919 [subsurface metagenome]
MNNLVLSIFPGIDLLGRAFEEEGYCIMRGPDMLWGGDIRNFHPATRMFDGIIGGAPCQSRSKMAHFKYISKLDLMPEFIRVVKEAGPRWVVMENVRGYRDHPDIPKDWFPVRLRDWDCGGQTNRVRLFWTYPGSLILSPPRRPGKAEFSVLASSWKNRGTKKQNRSQQTSLTVKTAAALQGFPEMAVVLKGLPRAYAVSLLGNGVPKAMGLHMARGIKTFVSANARSL